MLLVIHPLFRSNLNLDDWLGVLFNKILFFDIPLLYHYIKAKMYNSSKIIFSQNKYTYTAPQYWEKVSQIFHTFCLYLRLPAIMNLIFRTVRLGNFMTSCSDKLYHHAISIISSSIFWSFHLAKCPPAILCPCLARSQKSKEWLTSKSSAWNHTLLNRKKQKFQLLMAGILWVVWPAAMM